MSKETVIIYDYVDYKAFLAEWFEEKKRTRYGFSYRSFNIKADIKSPNYLQRVITGNRKMTPKYLPGICKAMELSEDEINYFTLLLQLSNNSDDIEREEILSQIITIRSTHTHHKLTQPMLHYLSHWYYPVVREAIVLYQTIDARKLTTIVSPKLSLKEMTGALNFLLQNEFIVEDGTAFTHRSPVLTTGDEILSDIVSHYHRENLHLTAEELTNTPLEIRDVSALTLSLSAETFKKVKNEIQTFRKKLLHIAENEVHSDRVYHVGFQLVPRTTIEQEEPNA